VGCRRAYRERRTNHKGALRDAVIQAVLPLPLARNSSKPISKRSAATDTKPLRTADSAILPVYTLCHRVF